MAEKSSDKLTFGRRTFIKGGLAASALLALAGCQKAKPAGGDKKSGGKGGVLRYYLGNPKCIEPFSMQESSGTQVGYQLFDGLARWSYKENKLLPLCAKSWESSKDGTEFTFHLRDGMKFHNGDPVDAESFKRSWTRIVNPKTSSSPSAISYHLALIQGYDDLLNGKAKDLSGLSAPDKLTFKIKLSAPYADFPIVCSHPTLAPVPKVALEDFDKFSRAPIGNGPFKIDGKWEDGQHIVLKRFDDYFGEKPIIDGIYFNIQKDLETAFREFQAGNLDVASVPTSQLKQAIQKYGEAEENGFVATPGHQVINGSMPSVYYLFFNLKDPVFKDADLRRALSLAVNRQAICDNFFAGTRKPAANIVPPPIAGYEKDAWKWSHYDKDEANKLLDKKYPKKADGSRGINLKITYNLDGGHKQIIQSAIADWKAIGINVESISKEWTSCIDDYQSHKAQMGRLGWNADYPIMDNFIYPLFYSTSDDNVTGFNDPAIDKEINEARKTIDPAERIAKFQVINKKIGDFCPCLPIMFYRLGYVASDKVQYLAFRPDGNCPMDKAKLVQS